jgi:hypothetical protein
VLCLQPCADEVFSALAAICKTRADFATFLFPHLLADFAASDRPDVLELRVAIGERLREDVLAATDGQQSHRVTSLVVSALNSIRAQLAAARMQDIRSLSIAGRRSHPFVHSCGFDIEFYGAVASILRPLSLTPSDVAVAAVRCSAFMTAVLFAELWVERKYGQVVLPERAEDAKKVTDILLGTLPSTTGSLLRATHSMLWVAG